MRLSFSDNRIRPYHISRMRGYIAKKFPQYLELHHHIEKNRLLYKYPFIQYKALKGIPIILAIHTGAKILKQIYDKVDEIQIENNHQLIFEKQIVMKNEMFCIASQPIAYQFITPWLSLNQDRYKEYKSINRDERRELLNKILIGNIISVAKALGYKIAERIEAKTEVYSKRVTLKGIAMIGFMGKFKVNFNLPDYIGLGKSVSRGFGTIKRI